jgi:hypothetical protein
MGMSPADPHDAAGSAPGGVLRFAGPNQGLFRQAEKTAQTQFARA